MRCFLRSPFFVSALLFAFLSFLIGSAHAQVAFDAEGTLWTPFIEWEVKNSTYEKNPFDVEATVIFTHTQRNVQHVTQMFYTGKDTWKWRFSGTELGTWTFSTVSEDAELSGLEGTVLIHPNQDPDAYGFLTHHTSQTHTKWARARGNRGNIEAFVPQLVMYDANPANYYNNPEYVDAAILEFIEVHGFSGFHLAVIGARWFDMDAPDNALSGNETDPDPRTFDALELLITRTQQAGGIVHIWPWGDASRDQVPLELSGGANGPLDERLQRYIAARLGPIPGWSMGYGFDLFEWTNEAMLKSWHANLQRFMGWPHYLGGRAHKNQLTQIYEGLDYAAYEWHRPTYDDYLNHSTKRPTKPAFSEDRFRIRNRDKDYSMEETRRGLWHATMAGGVANVWGNLRNPDGTISAFSNPYPNPEWIKTYASFWQDRFLRNMEPCNEVSGAFCYGDNSLKSYVLYKESTRSLTLSLSDDPTETTLSAIVVDTKKPYQELGPCDIPASGFTWNLPYESDWAVAVGTFEHATTSGAFDCALLPVELNRLDATSDGRDIVLNWSTVSELNNAGFEIQYKADDETAFLTAQFVEGRGTSNISHTYSARLPAFDPGSYTFRLRQIDFDGTFEYSKEVYHIHESSSPFTITQAYPAPFRNRASLTLSVSRPQRVKAILYDTVGRAVQTVFDQEVVAHTSYPITIEAGSLPNGPYFVQLIGDYFHSNEQVVLVK